MISHVRENIIILSIFVYYTSMFSDVDTNATTLSYNENSCPLHKLVPIASKQRRRGALVKISCI